MSKKAIHRCDKCESIATQIYPEYKLCDQHYREVNLIEVNKVFMELKELSEEQKSKLYTKGIIKTGGTVYNPVNYNLLSVAFKHENGMIETAKIKYNKNGAEFIVIPVLCRKRSKKP